MIAPHKSHHRWMTWLVKEALPLWENAGFDAKTYLYHERLTFDCAPLIVEERRLMVQARQVATYCRAACEGVHGDGAHALRCLAEMERLYHRPDGQPGWCFSIGDKLKPASLKRDLYAHAFVIYAYFWAYRLTGSPHYARMARETLADIQRLFVTQNDGIKSSYPSPDAARIQDPIMHLLEACLVWIPFAEQDEFRRQATEIVQMALQTLIDRGSGMLLEEFDEAWKPLSPEGQNRVEPGHLFEWSWLLQAYQRLNCDKDNAEKVKTAAERLFQLGHTFGMKNGAVIDSIDEFGHPIGRAYRIWPQTEFYRLLADRRQANDAPSEPIESAMDNLTDVFFEKMALPSLQGGWIDRLSADWVKNVSYMPASSLYHIFSAATAR